MKKILAFIGFAIAIQVIDLFSHSKPKFFHSIYYADDLVDQL